MALSPRPLWYDTAHCADLRHIDMLIVDGPPDFTQRLARYPALTLLAEQLSNDAVIVLHDAYRADEREIVRRRLAGFSGLVL